MHACEHACEHACMHACVRACMRACVRACMRIAYLSVYTYQRVRRGKKNNLMQRILPLFIMPFLLQSAIVPMFLSMLKFMLMKSLMVGKIALALIVFNAFKNHNSVRGRDAEIADVHYGYHGNGMEEYGAYVNN
ncbi:hypothetical protein EVAR_98438_1 [Eumeta japonica]|uniref:Uncharacterized protein n=1 Tax=Eumeta variegata TaxID=151549 RepID=A0A4C2A2W9_EUMVA|nr:hypothetical protein EVAR_98438_1 [Eumeta japonica]